MKRKQAKKIIDKYLKRKSSLREIKLLDSFLNSFQSKEDVDSDREFDEEIKSRIWSRIKSDILVIHPGKKRYVEWFKYAAVFIGLVAGIYVWLAQGTENRPELIIGDDAIILKTGMNSLKEIDLAGNGEIENEHGDAIASQKGGTIAYKTIEGIKELVYNEIMVPKGKTFELVLSDGTMVHLNSETILKFPVNFIEGQDRQVFLNGEAYFEVTKDKRHLFSVITNDLNVNVLGTHFVVNSYGNSQDFTVLAEGSVAVQNVHNGKEEIIKPGQKASLYESDIEVENVDVQDYLGWRKGILVFNDEPFVEIIEKIKRKYNVEIENSFDELEPEHFYGRFDNKTTVIDLLNTFKTSAGFDYEISDNKVIIKKPLSAYD